MYFQNLVYFTKYMKVYDLLAEYDSIVLILARLMFLDAVIRVRSRRRGRPKSRLDQRDGNV